MTAHEITDYMVNVYTDEPVEDWGGILRDMDMPSVSISMCAFLETAFSLVFEDDVVDAISEVLIGLFEE
jgi:hypothetical protein